jgi:hypothetical protein
MDNNKLKHLDYIHNTINRMSTNSFLIKGWSITIVSALFIFSDNKMNERILAIAVLAMMVFWYLNGYFLQQERKFRALYDKVRKLSESQIDFSMSTKEFKDDEYSLISGIFGKTIWPLYLSIIIMIIIIQYISESTVANTV